MSVLAHEGTHPILYGGYDFPRGSGRWPGYLARPDQAGQFPAVLVLADGGLKAIHKDLCRRLARHGLAALAVDPGSATDYAVGHVAQAHGFLMSADVNWVIKQQLGIIAFGEAGVPAVVYAADHPEVRAVSMISTVLRDDGAVVSALERLAVPVLGLYGAVDAPGSGVDDGRLLRGSFVTYSGVGGGFMDDGAVDYDAAASADALRRLIDFFARFLPAPLIDNLG